MSADVAERASVLINAGRPAEAIALLRQALSQEPDDTELLDELARAQLDVDLPGALETAKRLIALDPDGYRGHFLAALACSDLDRDKEAGRYAETAVAAAPYLAQTQAVYAQAICRQSRKRKQARAAAQRAIELAPEDTVGYVAAGNVELSAGKTKQAEKWYREALSIDPHDRAASLNLVLVSGARGRLAHAFGGADALLRFDPTDPDARQSLDRVVYTTLVHLLWVALPLLWIVGLVKGA